MAPPAIPSRGWRTVLLGAGVALLSLLPMGAALFDPRDAAFPSGRLPALLAGATFLFAGIWLLGAGLGRTWSFAVAALLSTFAGVPFAITLADASLARNLLATPVLSLLQSLFLGAIAAHLWSWALRERARAVEAPGGPRVLAASALGLAAISPFLAPLAPLAAAVGLAAPSIALAALGARTLGAEARAMRMARLAFTLAGLALVVAPARALVRIATATVTLPETRLPRLGVADPVWSATIDLVVAGAGLAAVAMAATRARMASGPLCDAATLLPDRAHAAVVAALSLGLATASAVELRPELLRDTGRIAPGSAMPSEVRRAVLRLASPEPAWRSRALGDLEALDADLAPAALHLLGLLDHADAGVRGAAATAMRTRGALLADAPCDPCRDVLLRGLASDVAEVRRLALVTLPALAPDDGAVLDRVRAAAVREGAALRDEGLAAIGQSGGTGKAILLTALESDDGSTNAALLRAVEPVMSAGERLALCRRLLASPDAGARWLAVTSLAALSPEEPAAASELATAVERERDPTVREAAFLALVEAAPQAAGDMDAAVLAPLLHARLWSARVEARRLLEALGDPRDVVVPALLDALDVGDSYAREEAMTHLARLGAPPEAAPKAARCLVEDTRQGLCVAAAALLGSMGADAAPAATTLADIAVGGDAYAASHALRALAAIGPPARDALPRLEAHVKITRHAPELLQAIASISAEVEPARGGTLP